MPLELSLTFDDPDHVQVRLLGPDGNQTVSPYPFTPPLDAKTRQDLTWYLETYPVHYTTELNSMRGRLGQVTTPPACASCRAAR